jgi:hypothetical protein
MIDHFAARLRAEFFLACLAAMELWGELLDEI